MTDNGDGTYSAKFLSNVEGNVTVIAYRYVPERLKVDWYNSTSFIKPAQFSEEWSSIIKAWSTTDMLYSTKSKNATAKIYFALYVPATDTYTFTLNSNDGSSVYMNGARVTNRLGATCNCTNRFNLRLTGGLYYDFRLVLITLKFCIELITLNY